MWNMKLWIVAAMGAAICVAGSAMYGYNKGKQSGMSQIKSEWALESAAIAAAQAEETMKARQREQALQAAANRIKQEKTREAIKLANDYAIVVDSLHDRPERPGPGSVSEGADAGTGSAAGCTGAQLYKSDAAVLARLARDADQLRLALKACVAHVGEVERQLNKE